MVGGRRGGGREEREKREAKGASEHTERARAGGRGHAEVGTLAQISVGLHPFICWGARRTSGKRKMRLGEGTGTK